MQGKTKQKRGLALGPSCGLVVRGRLAEVVLGVLGSALRDGSCSALPVVVQVLASSLAMHLG